MISIITHGTQQNANPKIMMSTIFDSFTSSRLKIDLESCGPRVASYSRRWLPIVSQHSDVAREDNDGWKSHEQCTEYNREEKTVFKRWKRHNTDGFSRMKNVSRRK
ncbi:hypothetical protein OS493_036496 [Desmophyllum pertusum]|uniref:Uncharacterized protein n=1 Tax=Desmophyllum pertusum TaxID=174260 RepID=A0A9W9ZX70_9CNID|nr:hypothetical protein OS493_036496 [Desmophyllum pertusum]